MENLHTEPAENNELVQIIRKGDLVTYNGELWIIQNLDENTADLIDPNNRSNIAPGVKRGEIIKGPDAISAPLKEESTPGRLLEQYCLSVGKILEPGIGMEPGYEFSKQGQTFAKAKGDFNGINPERQKIIVESGIANGYENIIFSDPENQN